jgi:hypothetical protein
MATSAIRFYEERGLSLEVEAMQASLAEQHRKLVAVRDMLTNKPEDGAASACQSFAD